MPLPDTYSELWPGRFLKADMLKGKRVTLTIKNIDIEELVGDKNKAEPKVIISFLERPLEYVCPKTNGFCMKRMWGNNPHDWIGKRVTIYPTTTKFGREDVDCIRIYGSPDIAEDIPITVPQGRKKAWETVMHKVVTKNGTSPETKAVASAGKPITGLDPRMVAAFEVLGYTREEQILYLEEHAAMSQPQMLSDLNRMIDERNAA